MNPTIAYDPNNPVVTGSQIAAQVSGLPADFLQSLIQLEGTLKPGDTSNNPFDITNIWLDLWGDSSIFVRLWNTLGFSGGQPYGVAVTSDPVKAIQAWWNGISLDKNYTQFRYDLATGKATVYQLALDLQHAGYAGNDTDYANKVAAIYRTNTGKDPNAPLDTTDILKVNPPGPGLDVATILKGGDPGSSSGGSISFGAGLEHILITVAIGVIALVLLALGVYLLARPSLPSPAIIAKAAEAA